MSSAMNLPILGRDATLENASRHILLGRLAAYAASSVRQYLVHVGTSSTMSDTTLTTGTPPPPPPSPNVLHHQG